VTVAATTEVTAVAALAAAAGVALYWLAAPLVALLELGGGRWFADDVRPLRRCWWGSSRGGAAGPRRLGRGHAPVVVGPLGVARRQATGGARLVRLLGVSRARGVRRRQRGAAGRTAADVTGWCSASACWRCSARCR
jgi:hypothetical protein